MKFKSSMMLTTSVQKDESLKCCTASLSATGHATSSTPTKRLYWRAIPDGTQTFSESETGENLEEVTNSAAGL